MHVLYVEDDPFDAELTRRDLLKSMPEIKLDISRTQQEAIQLLKDVTTYDLLLTDLRLPDGGGIELLSYVREQNLPLAVVVITGQGDQETAVSVLKAGADDYVVKRQEYRKNLALTLESALLRYRAEIARRTRPLRVLYGEQNMLDVDLTRRHFGSHAPHIHLTIVYSIPEVQRLATENPVGYDVVLLDYHLSSLSALELLKELRQVRRLDLPIILMTTHGDEEVAAQAIRLGANDYVVKSPGYLYQLPGLLENAYHHVQLRREQAALQSSEKRFRALIENSADGILLLDKDGYGRYASPSTARILGYTPEEYIGRNIFQLIHPDDFARHAEHINNLPNQPDGLISLQVRILNKDQQWRWIEMTAVNSLPEPAIQGIVVNFQDITERKLAEERIHRQLTHLNALHAVDQIITASLDLEKTLDALLDHVVSELFVDAAKVLLYNPKTQALEIAAGRGEMDCCPLPPGYAAQAAAEHRTIQVTLQPSTEVFEANSPPKGCSTYQAIPLINKDQVKGVLEVCHQADFELTPEWVNFFETLAGQAAIAIDNAELFAGMQQANENLTRAYDTTLEGWVRALDLRDKETEGHTQRVAVMTIRLARELGFGEEDIAHIRRGVLLHDIGKIGVPDSILNKPGSLTNEEWASIRMHPVYAYELLSPIAHLKQAIEIPYCHHEKWDGTGYPRGLKGEDIPLSARLFAVVDVWDALSTDRSYRQHWDQDKVLAYIRDNSGSHFDPQVVEIFLHLMDFI